MMGQRDRHNLLRSFAGIGFQGSVETDQMITRGLPGLMEAWSTGTSGVSDPAEASRRRLEIAQDFAAQVQSQAASGRSASSRGIAFDRAGAGGCNRISHRRGARQYALPRVCRSGSQ